MSIDAVIERTRGSEAGLRLELAPRVDAEGQDSNPGRSALTILGGRSFEPRVGMEIWGSAGWVEVIDRDPLSGIVRCQQEYDRKGVRLREPRKCPCGGTLHWADITNEETGEQREVLRCECGREEAL